MSLYNFKPALSINFRKTLAGYILLFPLASTVKYSDVASRMNCDDLKCCLSVKVSTIINSAFSSMDSAQVLSTFNISSSEKQSKNWHIQIISAPSGICGFSESQSIGWPEILSLNPL